MFTIVCPRCGAEVSLPARRLVVRLDAEPATSGEALFTCLACHETVLVPLDSSGVAAMLIGGVTYLSLAAPVVEHPEEPPSGPPLTRDDLLDLHRTLARTTWFDELDACCD